MPPEERHLWEIGREEVSHGNRPAKMYAKKERTYGVFYIQKIANYFRSRDSIEMPFVLPWENCAALQSQTGMNAFGRQRDPKIAIDQGHIELVQVGAKQFILFYIKKRPFRSKKT